MRKPVYIAATLVTAAVLGWAAWAQLDPWRGAAEFRVLARYPHDPSAFTQGLAAVDGRLYEGTGQYGASSLRRVDIETGRVEQMVNLDRAYFGEGITVFDGRIYQLTWQRQRGIVYDLESFAVLGTFRYAGEGWGLTHDGEHLIMSDGSATLKFIDPQSFEVVRRVVVRDGERTIARLNELEYIDGEVWANIWYDDRIVRIAPADGRVVGWLDLATLYPAGARGREEVLNGIAYDASRDRLFVTGKNWPALFEIEVRGR